MERKEFVGADDVLTDKIIGVFFEVYNELGYGFVEAVYCRSMQIALEKVGLRVTMEEPIPVRFRGHLVGTFRADLIVEGRIILELKVADSLTRIHEAQLINYLRASPIEVGLLLGFGESPRVRRTEFKNERKRGLQGSALIPS